MSPAVFSALSFASSLIQAAFSFLLHQALLQATLAAFSESIVFEAGIFMSGITVLCYAFSSLYSIGRLNISFPREVPMLVRAWSLALFLCVLFAFTSEYTIPLFPVMACMILFMAASYALRWSLRHYVLSSAAGEIVREQDTSLRKDYRHNMREILAKKSRVYFFLKRAFDIAASGLAMLILSPVLLITAIAVKLEDGGPVLYSAKRWGKNLQMFRMHKFRSMRVNAEAQLQNLLKDSEMTGHAFKIKDDPRITRVGKFIRKYSIDELPQLWNIFAGDMSVVGPRPIMTVDTDDIDDYDKQRWLVRPGLTCYWQVSGRADVKWAQWIEMDLDYIENMCLWEDFKLIFKTFPVVLKGEGAY